MTMSPDFIRTFRTAKPRTVQLLAADSAWETQASWRHGHFAAKSAPQHRDFAAGKVGIIH